MALNSHGIGLQLRLDGEAVIAPMEDVLLNH
jgi:hypothetical protein